MVNRVLTSPYLWWSDPLSAVAHMRGDPQSAGVLTYGNARFIPRPLDGQPE